MSDVLLTYGWVRSSYAALRNLKMHGINVCVSDSQKIGMSQFSRLKDKFELYPSHYTDEEGFVKKINEIIDQHKLNLILPSHNETEVLARYRHVLPDDATCLIPDAEHCALFNNKSRAYDFVQSIGLAVPLRIPYAKPEDLSAIIAASGIQKTVIKLLTGNSAKGVFYADDPASAGRIVEELISKYDLEPSRFPQVEEYVKGDGYGCSVLYWHGRRVAAFSHRRLREKIATGGTSTLREAVQNQVIEDTAKRIFDEIGWHGLAMCEFKVCAETGKVWFVEVNPRLWGSIALAISAGVEFPYLAWLCAVEGADAAVEYQAKRMVRFPWRSRWLLGDVSVAVRELLVGRILEAAKILVLTRADYVDDLFWDDPFVFLGELSVYAKNALVNRSLNPSEKGMVG